METEEALKYYIDEVKNTQHEIHLGEDEVDEPNEAEQATDFLQKAGLSDLSRLYQQGEEITENAVNHSVRIRNLTEKQAETVRFRIRTLNRTLRSRQIKRKPRQDIRDIAWNVETSSTGTRSRSATPDSLDSVEALNDDLTSDEDQQLSSLPSFPPDHNYHDLKTKVKWTSSEPLQNKKFNRTEKSDIAHLGSANVVLKGYQQLTENGTLPRPPQRERSGSDPTTEVHLLQPLKNLNANRDSFSKQNLHNQLSRSHNSITVDSNNCSRIYLSGNSENYTSVVSFEGLVKQNENEDLSIQMIEMEDGVSIDDLSDSEYQHLKSLLYVELVAILDQYKISYIKRKASNKTKGGNVFGVNLSTLVMRDMPRPTENSMVPKVFQIILSELNTRCISEDGILRIAGQKHKLDLLCHEIESKFFSHQKIVNNLIKSATTHELTAVLKKLLRDLPDPIFTMELIDMFYKTGVITNSEDKIRALNLLVLMLPIEHRNTCRALLDFFKNIVKHESKNRMNLHNVAMITAPSFFPPRLLIPKGNDNRISSLSKEELSSQINGAAVCCLIMETMLKASNVLWVVPRDLANQAKEAQKRAQTRKDMSKHKETRIRSAKTKLVRSSTQYEQGAMNVPRIKRDLII